jgi:hypothetical protein
MMASQDKILFFEVFESAMLSTGFSSLHVDRPVTVQFFG